MIGELASGPIRQTEGVLEVVVYHSRGCCCWQTVAKHRHGELEPLIADDRQSARRPTDSLRLPELNELRVR